MTTLNKNKLAKQWREDLLNLKDRKKQKMFSTDRALRIADKIKKDYEANNIDPDSNIQNAHIQLCNNIEQANKILSSYRADSVPFTTTTFNILISLSKDIKTATSYLNVLIDLNLKPNTYTLNGFIRYCKTVNHGYEIINEMHKYDVAPNTQTYNALLSLTTSKIEHDEILKKMQNDNINFNVVTYNTLIAHSKSYKTAIGYFYDMKYRKIKPTINTFITLLKKTDSKYEINNLERLLENENISPNNTWFRYLREKYGR